MFEFIQSAFSKTEHEFLNLFSTKSNMYVIQLGLNILILQNSTIRIGDSETIENKVIYIEDKFWQRYHRMQDSFRRVYTSDHIEQGLFHAEDLVAGDDCSNLRDFRQCICRDSKSCRIASASYGTVGDNEAGVMTISLLYI